MSGYGETKKQLGNFNSESGGYVTVNIIFVERQVYVGTDRKGFQIPVALEFFCNGMEMRIRAADVRGFIGLLGGQVEEFTRIREMILRRLENLGAKTEDL